MKTILYYCIFMSFIFNVNATTLKINEYYKIEGSWACIELASITFKDNGYISWKFKREGDSGCRDAKVTFAKSTPQNLLRGAKNISPNNTFDKSFYILSTPEIKILSIMTSNRVGVEGWVNFNAKQKIPLLLEIANLGDWKKNFSNTETLLVEKKSKDKTPPKIKILSPSLNNENRLIVDTYSAFIRGKATDKNGILNILIKGKKVRVKEDGTFASKVKLAFGKNEISIKAEDINNNISEKKIVIVRKEFISEQNLVDVDFPPKTKMRNPDALAVVIGVENYQYVPDATYAYNDAEVFREYLSDTLGFKKQRIKIATNSKATQAELNKLLGANGWLSRNIVKGKSDVVVYFSGHGIANPKNNNTGILPFDVDPNYAIGLPIKDLYYNLSKMGAKSVTVYLDACFTGQTRDSKMLIADARPIIISPNKDSIPSNVTVFSASSGSQISGAIKEKEHGLFTYYLLKGMSGDADINKDKSIQINELSKYVSKNVKNQAAINGREQTPELKGSKDRVLVRFN